MSVDEKNEELEELSTETEGLPFIMEASLVSTYGHSFHIELDGYNMLNVISQRFVSSVAFDLHRPAGTSW